MIIIGYIIPVFIMFASTFKVLTGLSLAIVLARFLALRGALRWQPQNLSNGDSSLAKIGVNLVSCSCGKWSPLYADHPQTASAINHQKPFVVLIDHNGLVLHILYFAWNFCIKLVPHQLTVILGLVSTRAIFWEINIPKIWSWQGVIPKDLSWSAKSRRWLFGRPRSGVFDS